MKSRKTSLQTELRILEEQSKNSLTFNDGEVMQALMNLREMVKNPRDEDNLKQVYAIFVDCIEVHEGYVTIALKILPILGYRRNSYPILNKKMPPLEFHQMVAWNGGAEPLPISEAWGHIADESDPSSKLEEGIEQTNLRKMPLCQVIVKNPIGQLWLVGKDVLQGPRNGR